MQLKLPELGEGVHEGELIKWKVQVGDQVKDDQLICEIMTDKATIELPAPFHGKVTQLMAKEGEVVHVGQVLLEYDSGAGASTSKAPTASTPSASKPASQAPAPMAAAAAAPVQNKGSSTSLAGVNAAPQSSAPAPQGASLNSDILAAPSTRKLAREMGIDLSTVQGSGPAGRIMREDLDKGSASRGTGAVTAGAPTMARSAYSRGPSAQTEERVPFRGLRKKISEKMRLSKDKAAHFTYVEEADASALVQLRAQAKEIGAKQGVKVTYLPFIMKAMVAAMKQYPILNSTLDEEKGEIVLKHYYNISLSVQTDDGLMAPVVKDVGNKSIIELARDIAVLADKARNKKLTMEDLTGGTITLTNAGTIGGLFTTPVINYPEVAILGFNKIFKKPHVISQNGKDEIVIRDWTYFAISLDHRVVDGAIAAEFMKVFINYIENPSLLLLESI